MLGYPNLALSCADGQALPYAAASFDLILQFTAFSSLLDDGVKQRVAAEMRRVLRPAGLIIWYDFWINPSNPRTRGIGRAEIRRLFPGCRIDLRRITLAPPVARRLARRCWLACVALEDLKFLNTHYLAAITPSAM